MNINDIPAEAIIRDRSRTFVRVKLVKSETVEKRHEDFGISDNKGREVGCIYILDREVRAITTEVDAYTELREVDMLDNLLGETFHACVFSLRRSWLLLSFCRRFRNLEEAEAHAETMIKEAREKALKRYGSKSKSQNDQSDVLTSGADRRER